jgi:hypothetical protein
MAVLMPLDGGAGAAAAAGVCRELLASDFSLDTGGIEHRPRSFAECYFPLGRA